MQCRDVEVVLEQEGLAPLPEAARDHVASCTHCQGLIADLETIISLSVELPAEVEPPARVWVSLRNQLEHEGIIKQPVAVPAQEHSSLWEGFGRLFRSRAFATVAVGAFLLIAAFLQVRGPSEPLGPPSGTPNPLWQTAKVLNEQEIDLRNMHLSSTSPVDVALEQNLQQVNEFIADCERHLKAEPQDELAREYLSDAYQQKAELLSAMMDRGRSVN
ncbi:MAG TPA: hypothetical protein VEI73_10980 [Candidatus Acidoferrum sp.]|nr:hypothetical protein [Candidatus Acidoferrum sp.]